MEQSTQLVTRDIKLYQGTGAGANLCEFLHNNYNKAINLKYRFRRLEEKEWDSLTVTSELTVQIGHIFNIFIKDEDISEMNRTFMNLGDELSDVLLQLTYLTYLEGFSITIEDMSNYRGYEYANIVALPILLGQLHEALLEKNGYRFTKARVGFNNISEFIKDRVTKMYLVIFNFAKMNCIDLDQEFEKMNQDATNFIVRKLSNGTA